MSPGAHIFHKGHAMTMCDVLEIVTLALKFRSAEISRND